MHIETFNQHVFDEIYRFNVLHKGPTVEDTKEGHAKAIFNFLIDDIETECDYFNKEAEEFKTKLEDENAELQQENVILTQELEVLDNYAENIQAFIAHLQAEGIIKVDVLEALLDDFNLKEIQDNN